MTETQNKAVNDILDIFGIQEGAVENSDSNESYGDSEGKGKVAFEESISDFGDAIKEEAKNTPKLQIKEPVKVVENKSSTPGPEIKKVEEKSGKDLIKESISPTIDITDTNEISEASGDDIFATVETKAEENVDIGGSNNCADSIVSVAEIEKAPEKHNSAEESPQEPIPFDTPTDNGESGTPTETDSEAKTEMVSSDTYSFPKGWISSSSSEKFKVFYQAKAEILKDLLEDGEIPFVQFRKELSEAKVDPYVPSFEPSEITKRMGDSVKWTSRVAYIFVKVSTQLCIGERGTELLRGVLARIEYEKPKERNEGIVFEHMRDLEMYVAKTKSMANIAEFTIKMLEKSWNTLSRQLSVLLGDKDKIEKHETGRSHYPSRTFASTLGAQGYSVSETSKTGDVADGIEGTIQLSPSQPIKGSQTIEWDAIK